MLWFIAVIKSAGECQIELFHDLVHYKYICRALSYMITPIVNMI